MRFPSLTVAWSHAAATARRFPFVIAAGVVAAFAAIMLEEAEGSHAGYQSLLAASTLGLPLLFSLTVVGEVRGWRKPYDEGERGRRRLACDFVQSFDNLLCLFIGAFCQTAAQPFDATGLFSPTHRSTVLQEPL